MVTVVANKNVAQQISQSNNITFDRDFCQLQVHLDWKPFGCAKFNTSVPLQQQIVSIIRTASTFNFKGDKSPTELKASGIRKQLKRLAVDAAAAAIEEGQCFDNTSADPSPRNAAARFSRQLRTRMNRAENANIYITEQQEILAVGVNFEYVSGVSSQKGRQYHTYKTCMLGLSFAGENTTDTFGNHEVGFVGKKNLPPGDKTEIWKEVLLTMLLVVANVAAPRVCEFFSACLHLRNRLPRGVVALLGILVLAVLQIIFTSDFNPWSDWKLSLS